jgi:hypothetical protein
MTHFAVLRRLSGEGTLTSMDEAQGIYRGEVLALMGALADHTRTLCAYFKYSKRTARTMKNPKKWTPEEWREWRKRGEARQRELHAHMERIKAELASAKKKSA